MAQNTEKNTKLRDDNIDITNKFKTLCEQFEKREDQMIRMAKQMELEKQLSEAHINKAEYELKAERELWSKEREIAQQNIKSGEERIESLHTHIAGLEAHLRIYTDKYAEFESTISKSNQVFDNYKTEMGKLSKQMTKVDKESQAWKNRWERNAQAILELTETNQLQELRLHKSDKRLEQMQNLCRQLQVERSAYLTLLRANGIEPKVSNVVLEEVCAPPTTSSPQIRSRKEMELDILQEEMACLKKKLKEEEQALHELESGTSSPELKGGQKEAGSGGGKRRRRRGGKKNGTDNKDLSPIKTDVTVSTAVVDKEATERVPVQVEPPTATPVVASVAAPVAAPNEAPVATPVAAPVAAPVATPVAAPNVAPVAAPNVAPVATPVVAPVATPVVAPVATPVVATVATPVVSPVATPVVAPVATPVVAPVAAPIVAPVAAPVAAPIVPAVAAPVVAPVDTPVAAPTVPPAAAPVVAPVATPVVTPVAAPVVTPVAAPVVIPIVAPVAAPVAVSAAAPTTENVTKPDVTLDKNALGNAPDADSSCSSALPKEL